MNKEELILLENKVLNGDINACFLLASFYSENSNFKRAKEYCLKAIEIDPSDIRGYYNLALTYELLGDIDNAIKYYLKTVELDPKYTDAYLNLGNIYFDKEDYLKAEECYLKVLDIENANSHAIYNLGVLYSNLEQYDKTIYYLSKALEINKDKINCYVLLENAYSKLGQFDKSIEVYSRLIANIPDDPEGYLYLSYLYQENNQHDKAKECLLEAINNNHYDSNTYLLLAFLLIEEDEESSINFFKKSIELNNNNYEAHAMLGLLIALSKGEYIEGRSLIEKAIKINKDNPLAYYFLSLLIDISPNYDIKESFSNLRKAMELNLPLAYIRAASYYYENDELISFNDAVKYLEKAIELNEYEAYKELGDLYLDNKDNDKALYYYLKAKEIGIDVDYEIRQINNHFNSDFLIKLNNFISSSSNSNESITLFLKDILNKEYDKLTPISKEHLSRCIYNYSNEYHFLNSDYSSAMIFLSKALECELREHLKDDLYNYLNKQNKSYKDIMLGSYMYIYSKKDNTRVLPQDRLVALQKCFKDNAFGSISSDINLTNYILNLVKIVKKYTDAVRNIAAHDSKNRKISKEKADKWLDRFLGNGEILHNFLSKLK